MPNSIVSITKSAMIEGGAGKVACVRLDYEIKRDLYVEPAQGHREAFLLAWQREARKHCAELANSTV
jgi:hypothetical protein